jgi:hypothetical protein
MHFSNSHRPTPRPGERATGHRAQQAGLTLAPPKCVTDAAPLLEALPPSYFEKQADLLQACLLSDDPRLVRLAEKCKAAHLRLLEAAEEARRGNG